MTDRKARIMEIFATIVVAPLYLLFGDPHGRDIAEWWDRRQDARRPRRRERRRGE